MSSENQRTPSFRQANIVFDRLSIRQRYLKVPLRVRLTLWYTLVLATALFGFGLFAYWTVSKSLFTNVDSMLAEVGTYIDESIAHDLHQTQSMMRNPIGPRTAPKQPAEHSPIPPHLGKFSGSDSTLNRLSDLDFNSLWSDINRSLFIRSRNFHVQVADSNGKVLWRSHSLGRFQLPTYEEVTNGLDTGRVFLTAKAPNMQLRVQAMQSTYAQISIAYNLSDVSGILVQLTDAFRIGFPLSVLLALAIGYALARYSLRQVDIITNAAKRITAENLSKRLPLPATNDEILRLTTTLNEMIGRLEGSFTQVRQFTSDVSHELRTPLAILMGELELALRREMDEEEYQSMVASALEEVVRLSKMVSSLLEISRAETGQVKLNKTLFDISKMTSDICDDMEILAEDKRVVMEKNIQPFVTIIADESRLHQALLNVIDNAIKYTHVNGTVRVSLSTKANQTKIEISDTGVGISEEDLPFVFNRFFRVDKARSSDVVGSGLGLSIVRWIIEVHRGDIRVKSELGVGSTFTIVLPYES